MGTDCVVAPGRKNRNKNLVTCTCIQRKNNLSELSSSTVAHNNLCGSAGLVPRSFFHEDLPHELVILLDAVRRMLSASIALKSLSATGVFARALRLRMGFVRLST